MRGWCCYALLTALAILGAGCDYQGVYNEPDYIEKNPKPLARDRRVDFEKVIAAGAVAGYVETVYHEDSSLHDYFVYTPNLKIIGYISNDGRTYKYYPEFERLRHDGDFDLHGGVTHLLQIATDFYIVDADNELTYEQLEQIQLGKNKQQRIALGLDTPDK